MNTQRSTLREANSLAREGAFSEAIKLYEQAEDANPYLRRIAAFNKRLCELKIAQAKESQNLKSNLSQLDFDTRKSLTKAHNQKEPLLLGRRDEGNAPRQNADINGKSSIDCNPILHWSDSADRCIIDAKNSAIQQGFFDGASYLLANSDIKRAGVDPYIHYMTQGWKENRPCHSEIYDFNKYLEVYSDVAKAAINPILHYMRCGRLEGRRLFHTERHLKQINESSEVTLARFIEHRKLKKACDDAIVIINFNTDKVINNPAPIYSGYDYIVIGIPPKKTEADSAWLYRPIRYHLNDMAKLESFAIINLAQQLSEYRRVVWTTCESYLNSREFYAALKQSEAATHKITIAGSIQRLPSDSQNCAIGHFLSSAGIDPDGDRKIDLIAPNFISYKDMTRYEMALLSQWWHFSARENLGRLIPLGIINSIGCQALIEKRHEGKRETVTTNVYLSTMNTILADNLQTKTLLSNSISSGLPRVVIIVPVFNAIDDTKKCLDSILTSSYQNFHLIIADDGSQPCAQKWLEDFSDKDVRITFLKADHNRGYTININEAIRYCDNYDFIILLNSDTIVCGDWIQKLLQRFADDKYVGIAGPLSNKAGWQSFPMLRGENQLPQGMSLEKINQILEISNHNSICPEVDIINGFCICISKEVFHEIGFFDEESFPLGYGEEDDFCMRSRLAGFKNVITLDTYVFHAKSKSMGNEKRLALATKGRTILDRRYQKSHYLGLTESIGSNPIVNMARCDAERSLLPYREAVSIIGEKVKSIEAGFSYLLAAQPSILVHLHCHYVGMCPYISHYLQHIQFKHDLVVTTSDNIEDDFFFTHLKSSQTDSIRIIRVENRGRDVYPFYLAMIDANAIECYDFVLHIHTKRSKHDPLLCVNWLSHLLSGVLHSPHYVSNLLSLMTSEDIGLAFPKVLEQHYPSYKWGGNKDIAINLSYDAGIDTKDLDRQFSFPAGFMFWARPKYLRKLTSLPIHSSSFPLEPIPIDGTLAHALERMLTHFVEAEGGKASPINPANTAPFENELNFFSSNLLSIKKVESTIIDAIRRRKSFALIRYYDGEGAFFKAKDWSSGYCKERMGYYFGPGEYTLNDAATIGRTILESIESADIIGIPNIEIVEQIISYAELYCPGGIEKLPGLSRRFSSHIDCSSAWRIISAFQLVCTSLARVAEYTTKDVHYDLVRSGGIYRIIDAAKDVRLITSQPVAPLLKQIFGKSFISYEIPARALDIATSTNTSHYPSHNVMLRKKLQCIDFEGVLVLVGAGPLGKEYCSIIKDRGGIAIDIGAVFDSWINFLTRPEHANSDGAIASELLLTSYNVKILSRLAVVPKADIRVEHLPEAKRNPHVAKNLN